MKAWFKCELVDSDTGARQTLCVIDAADRETAGKKCRARYAGTFRRLTTNKWQLSVEPTSAPNTMPPKVSHARPEDPTGQIFTREMAP